MSYALYSENGFVADIASSNGFHSMARFIDAVKPDSALVELINTGRSQYPEVAVKDIDELLPTIQDEALKTTLQGLQKALKSVKEIAIIFQ